MAALPGPARFWKGTKPPRGTELNRAHPLARGLLCYLPMSAGTGPEWDYAGRRRSVTVGNAPQWRASPVGTVAYMGNYGGTPNTGCYVPGVFASQPASPTIAVSAWPILTAGAQFFLSVSVLDLDFYGSTTLEYGVHAQGVGFKSGDHVFGTAIAPGSQVAFTYLNTGGTMDARIWWNGVRLKDDSFGTGYAPLDYATMGADLVIGTDSETSVPNAENGYIAWVAVWNRPLLDVEVAWLYHEPYALFDPPRRYWSAALPPGPIASPEQMVLPVPMREAPWTVSVSM
jgi:hypothetical protein